MTLPAWQGLAARNDNGDIVTLASPDVTVTDKATGGQPTVYKDRAGSNPYSTNPFTAGADGKIVFHAPPGRYKVEATDGVNTVTWDDQVIGTLHGIDQPADTEHPEYDAANDRWVRRPRGYRVDTSSGTAYAGAVTGQVPYLEEQ